MKEDPESLLMTIKGEKLISRRTLNLIFGNTGTGKSSLTHAIISALIHREKYLPDLMLRNENKKETVVLWVDTELFDNEFVKAREKILSMAGRQIDDYCLLPLRLQSMSNSDDIESLRITVEGLTSGCDGRNLVVVVDTITDLVEDFNDVKQSQALKGELLAMIRNYGCTFICIMHEVNGKPIGHIGSALNRKSGSTIQICRSEDFITLKNTKNRNDKEHAVIRAEFGDGPYLRLAGSSGFQQTKSERSPGRPLKVRYDQLDPEIKQLIASNQAPTKGIIRIWSQKYQCREKTITNRIKLIQSEHLMVSRNT